MNRGQQYMDLIVREVGPSFARRSGGDYRFCTLSHRGGEFYINLRLPDTIKDKIVQAIEQGKEVRIFS